MRSSHVLTIALLTLGACGGKGANNAASDDPNDCGNVATKITALMATKNELNTVEAKTKVQNAIAGTCTTGDWSVEVRACFVKAADEGAVAACGDKLTDVQKKDMMQSLGLDNGSAAPAPAE